ncbi:MAG: penicillin-binding protein [Ignavibacteria bacterium]|nr:penicillin-binding protein [Ignavibacteria bacterium]
MKIKLLLVVLLLSICSTCPQDLPPIHIDFASQVLTSDGRVLGYIGEKNRVDARSTGYISKNVIYALLATEDRDFYNHSGVSYKGIIRGIFKTLTSQTQGGSTLTMQLVKNLFLSSERTISRKLTEIDMAKKLEEKFSKDQILLMYLNTVYFGQGVYGIYAAAEQYYGKTPDKLTIPEACAIVGLLKNPTGYDPVNHSDKMLSRRNEVLHNLVETGKITEKEFQKYKGTPLGLKLNNHYGRFFVEQARKEAVEILRPYGKSLNTDEMKIYTTCNFDVQKAADEAVRAQWANFSGNMKNAQVGLITIENGTGAVRAMVGGSPESDFRGLNRAMQIRRQPGSSFKPFLYGTLLENGYTLATPLLDSAIYIDSGKVNEWHPQNSDNKSTDGYMPMQTAIQHSVNQAAAWAITHLTIPDSVVSFAHRLGIRSTIPSYPSIALGTGEVSPAEMASAMAVYATEGTYAAPYCVTKIEDKNGRVYYSAPANPTSVVLDSATCYLATTAFQSVVEAGTATSVRRFYKGFAAGKTGTSNDYTDAWFVGYTKGLTSAIWMGFDNPKFKLGGGYQYGGTACAPIWGRMMAGSPAHYKGTVADYTMPPTIQLVELCTDSGKLAVPGCYHKRIYPVNTLRLPELCPIHGAHNSNPGNAN